MQTIFHLGTFNVCTAPEGKEAPSNVQELLDLLLHGEEQQGLGTEYSPSPCNVRSLEGRGLASSGQNSSNLSKAKQAELLL